MQLEAVLRLLDHACADAVTGVYLHGSAVAGGLRPDSDVDVLVVTDRSLERRERVALVDRLLDVSGRRARRTPGRPVELTVVVGEALRSWTYPPRQDFQYGEWLRDEYEAGAVPAPRPDPDLAVLLTSARDRCAVLRGPHLATLLEPVPQAHLLRASAAGVPALLQDLHSDTRNVLLTLCRVWLTLSTGTVAGKDEAAAWALQRVPAEDREVLRLARSAYLGEADDDWAARRADVSRAALALAREVEQCTREVG